MSRRHAWLGGSCGRCGLVIVTPSGNDRHVVSNAPFDPPGVYSIDTSGSVNQLGDCDAVVVERVMRS